VGKEKHMGCGNSREKGRTVGTTKKRKKKFVPEHMGDRQKEKGTEISGDRVLGGNGAPCDSRGPMDTVEPGSRRKRGQPAGNFTTCICTEGRRLGKLSREKLWFEEEKKRDDTASWAFRDRG